MIKETPEGNTHYFNDGCGMREHNPTNQDLIDQGFTPPETPNEQPPEKRAVRSVEVEGVEEMVQAFHNLIHRHVRNGGFWNEEKMESWLRQAFLSISLFHTSALLNTLVEEVEGIKDEYKNDENAFNHGLQAMKGDVLTLLKAHIN